MKNIFFIGLATLLVLYSCNNDDQSIGRIDIESLYDQDSNLKREFGKALIGAMKQSKALRELLKTEALKMFDKEYDVLYLLIKDKQLENTSVEELLTKHLGGKEKLDEIISQYPTLTILVPELPNNSFSAKLWDSESMIPAVAIQRGKRVGMGGVPFIKANGSEDVIARDYIPAFPILVIKVNERVVASSNTNHKWFNKLETRTLYNSGGRPTLKFWNNAFDPSKTPKEMGKQDNGLDPKLIDAYNIYKDAYGWHRDYIYYGITPSHPNGQFSNEYKEYIKSFSLVGQADNSYNKVNPENYWTDGLFEFVVVANVNGKNSGAQKTTVVSVDADDLFTIQYNRSGNRFRPSVTSLKTASVDLPLFSWDLEEYCSGIKLEVYEVDLPEIITVTEIRSVGYAANFKSNEKVGLALGASKLEIKTKTYALTTYPAKSNFFGEVIVNYADKVIIGKNGSSYTTRVYSTGYLKLGVAPVKVQ